jgi:hypothetical protein
VYIISDVNLLPFRLVTAGRFAIRKFIVHEHNPMTDKASFTNIHQGANETMTLHLGTCTNAHPLLDLAEWTYKTIIAKVTSVQVHRLHNAYIFAAGHVDNSAG